LAVVGAPLAQIKPSFGWRDFNVWPQRAEIARYYAAEWSISSTVAAFGIVAGLAIVSAGLLRGGFAFSLLGIRVIDRSGRQAPRWRCMWRSAITWAPALVIPCLGITREHLPFQIMSMLYTPIVLALAYGAAAVQSILRPSHSWVDLLAGTRLATR
jgi:hypothetical protein